MTKTISMAAVPRQAVLFDDIRKLPGRHGTFQPNHKVSVHRWYPYVEGFSSDFVQNLFDEFAFPGCRVYDPFTGTGTTATVAASNGAVASYSEVNPFMRLVVECKTNHLRHVARRRQELSRYLREVEHTAENCVPPHVDACHEQSLAFGDRQFFRDNRLDEVVSIKRAIANVPATDPSFLALARLALGSIAVACSEMKRAADLRYRTPEERHVDGFSPLVAFDEKICQILEDISESCENLPMVTCLSESALAELEVLDCIDLIVTSPPYLNGTNYFRNTKLELWLAGHLKHERELGQLRDRAMAAGINDISRRGRPPRLIEAVERVATSLDEVAYDRRIPELVRRYFSDTVLWVRNAYRLLRSGGTALVDIGDSRFAGVHVPVDEIMATIARECGFDLTETRLVRSRKSKDGSQLKQVLLVLTKPGGNGSRRVPSNRSSVDDFQQAAVRFGQSLPHWEEPFASRNWGHGLHSLCSYQGKLKPAIAHFLVADFSRLGDRVLDPFSGCGTVPLEAYLQGRQAIGNDLQPLAHILTLAKVQRGSVDGAFSLLADLLRFVADTKDDQAVQPQSDFGFNGPLSSYFNEETFREILAARAFLKARPCVSWEQAVVYSCLLHILHGNRPYALSRRSHPVTPFKPTGPTEYRSLASRLKGKLSRSLAAQVPARLINGTATEFCYSQLPFRGDIDVVITSPPFTNSTRFFSSNWMRLWLAGWEPSDFNEQRDKFLERIQRRSMDVYCGFFQASSRWLRPGGRLIMHVGRTASCNMAEELVARAADSFELVHRFDEDVAGREKFGVRDQGATTSHQYVFFRRLD